MTDPKSEQLREREIHHCPMVDAGNLDCHCDCEKQLDQYKETIRLLRQGLESILSVRPKCFCGELAKEALAKAGKLEVEK